jgi:transcriptional regulator with XRE-family HTH domain
MKHIKYITLTVLAMLTLSRFHASGQTPAVQTPAELAKALGFTTAEIAQIEAGEIVNKDLQEGSDKELAGVVAVFFKKPVSELVELALQGKMLETDKDIRAFRGWKPDASADEAFAAVALDASESDEVEIFSRASAGERLNLSDAEIAQFRKTKRDPGAVSAEIRTMLKARYAAYLQSGLNGIAPYARGGSKSARPGDELALAIKETMTAARRQDYFQALLSYPANPLPDVEHRFYWFKQTVEGRPTFVLAHRASRSSANAALLTEEQYYVGHSYNSNFIAGGGLQVRGGTLVFYVNRTFTDQVAGFGSGMKHSIGRGRMLDEVAGNLKRIRDQLQR